MLNKKKNNKGFTLVELLVVIAIIGILAVVAVPALFSNINKAKIADLEADYSAFKSAALSYYSDENSFTSIATEGSITAAGTAATDGKTVEDNNDLKDYMESIPTKSPFGTSYKLINDANHGLVLECEVPPSGISGKESKKLRSDLGTDTVLSPSSNDDLKSGVIQLVITKTN